MSISRLAILITALLGLAGPAVGQVSLPSIENIGTQDFSDNSPITASFTNASQAPGTGYTVFQYGDTNGGVIFSASSVAPAFLQLATRSASGGASAANAAPDVFSNTTPYSFTIFRNIPSDPAAQILIPTTNGATTYFDLTNMANKAPAEARLNQALRFDASQFIDPATGNAIVTTGSNAVGSFAFALDAYNATTGYQNIVLNYTPSPVPEPTSLLALSAAGLGAFRLLSKLRRVGS